MECHQIVTIEDAKEKLELNGRSLSESDEMLETNKAFVFYMETNEVILISNDFSEAIIFLNKSCFEDCQARGEFPIQEKNPPLEFLYRDILSEINRNISRVFQKLYANRYKREFTGKISQEDLEQLLNECKRTFRSLSKEHKLFASLLLGEYLRRSLGGQWLLQKQYASFNPYYIPSIVTKNEKVILFWSYLKGFFLDSNTTLEIYLNLPWIGQSSLTFDKMQRGNDLIRLPMFEH